VTRQTFHRYCLDIPLGLVLGIISTISPLTYKVITVLAVFGLLIMLAMKIDLSTYCNDEKGKFSLKALVQRFVTVNVAFLIAVYFATPS